VVTDDLYSSQEKETDYGAVSIISSFNKKALIDKIEADTNPAHFEHFKPLIGKIRTILQLDDSSLPITTEEDSPNEQAR